MAGNHWKSEQRGRLKTMRPVIALRRVSSPNEVGRIAQHGIEKEVRKGRFMKTLT